MFNKIRRIYTRKRKRKPKRFPFFLVEKRQNCREKKSLELAKEVMISRFHRPPNSRPQHAHVKFLARVLSSAS